MLVYILYLQLIPRSGKGGLVIHYILNKGLMFGCILERPYLQEYLLLSRKSLPATRGNTWQSLGTQPCITLIGVYLHPITKEPKKGKKRELINWSWKWYICIYIYLFSIWAWRYWFLAAHPWLRQDWQQEIELWEQKWGQWGSPKVAAYIYTSVME